MTVKDRMGCSSVIVSDSQKPSNTPFGVFLMTTTVPNAWLRLRKSSIKKGKWRHKERMG